MIFRIILNCILYYPLRLLIRELGAPWCYTHCYLADHR